MREHQIIINLKPEQFEEVQRMARAAGSKSLGLFVRQKLLTTLGLGGSNTLKDGEQLDNSELKLLTGELRRLHRELQIFLADSTPTTSPEALTPFPRAVQENFLTEGVPLMPESVALNEAQSQRPEPPLPYSIPMPPPDEIHSFGEVDELENLADRAFAISPRLGALDEPQPKPFPDPLKELLNDAFLSAQNEEEDEPQLEQAEEQPEEAPADAAEAEAEGEAADIGEEEVAEDEVEEELVEDGTVAPNEEEREETENTGDHGEDDDIDENPDSEGDEPPSAPTPPPTPPVISGGPPPRKRHT